MFSVKVAKPEFKEVGGILPSSAELDGIFINLETEISKLIEAEAATVIDLLSAYSKDMISQYYVGGTPRGLNIGTSAGCHGTGVNVTTFRSYFLDRGLALHPDDFRARYGRYPGIFMREGGKNYQVHTMRGNRRNGLGRAGGDIGWDTTRELFAFGLASFRQNFQALLGAFSSRPSLPSNQHWHLPNLIHERRAAGIEKAYGARVVEPTLAIPPASYNFSLLLPSPLLVLAVGTKCPRKVETYCEFWDGGKKDALEAFKVEFPEGESETMLTLTSSLLSPIKSGYFNINPTNSEMTVSYVDMIMPPR